VLSAIILTLCKIDYRIPGPVTLQQAYEILEKYRQTIHNPEVRKLLLATMTDLIEVNFYANERISIDLISNIDPREREWVVEDFSEKYLRQRAKLQGGNYTVQLNNVKFESWSDPKERPVTQIEELLGHWKKSKHHVLSQIAVQSYMSFDRIENQERQFIKDWLNKRDARNKETEKRKKELEEKGTPEYHGDIPLTEEASAFYKINLPLVNGDEQRQVLRNTGILILKDRLAEDQAQKLIDRIVDDPTGRDSRSARGIFYVYKLFIGKPPDWQDRPLLPNTWSTTFIALSILWVPSEKRYLLRGFAPLLLLTGNLTSREAGLIIRKFSRGNGGFIRVVYTLCKNPVLLLVVAFIILILLFKIIL
jgi:hypothetical protein